MNEPWKRLIEAERRVMRLESLLQRQNTRIVSVAGAIQNDSLNVTNPFGSGGGGGGGGIGAVHRFPEEFTVRVEWDVVPTLKTGASSNPTADVTSLAEAVAFLETGVTVSLSNVDVGSGDLKNHFLYDTNSSKAALFAYIKSQATTTISGRTEFWSSFNQFALFDDGNFLNDPQTPAFTSGALFRGSLAPIASGTQTTRFGVAWPRRNGIGSYIGSVTLWAYRNLASEDNFIYGPTYGETGSWSFAMATNETTYHNAGSGTIFFEWGGSGSTIISGGSPDGLPTDTYDGGTPADLPADIIDGGLI